MSVVQCPGCLDDHPWFSPADKRDERSGYAAEQDERGDDDNSEKESRRAREESEGMTHKSKE